MLAFSSACLVDSPCRYTHLAALDTARTAGVPVCFVPALRPTLWPSEKTLRDTVLQFLPFADILVLTADEMELLLDTREYQVGLFALLRGHTQLVVIETEEASTPSPGQYTHSGPGFPPRPKSWPHGCCIKSLSRS